MTMMTSTPNVFSHIDLLRAIGVRDAGTGRKDSGAENRAGDRSSYPGNGALESGRWLEYISVSGAGMDLASDDSLSLAMPCVLDNAFPRLHSESGTNEWIHSCHHGAGRRHRLPA